MKFTKRHISTLCAAVLFCASIPANGVGISLKLEDDGVLDQAAKAIQAAANTVLISSEKAQSAANLIGKTPGYLALNVVAAACVIAGLTAGYKSVQQPKKSAERIDWSPVLPLAAFGFAAGTGGISLFLFQKKIIDWTFA